MPYAYGDWWQVVQSMIPEYGWPRIMELAESGWIKQNYPDFDSVGQAFLDRKYHEYNLSLQERDSGGFGGALKKIGGAIKSAFSGDFSKVAALTAFAGVKELDVLRPIFPTALSSQVHQLAATVGAPMVVPSLTDTLKSYLPSQLTAGYDTLMQWRDTARTFLPENTQMDLLDTLRNLINGGGTTAPAMTLPAMPNLSMALGPFLGSAASAGRALLGSGIVAGAVGIVRTAAGAIRGVMTAGGRFISSRKAVELAKRVGIDAAAVALGISAVEMAQMVLDEGVKPRRRGKGITAASMRTTRRTMRQIERMHTQIHRAARVAVRHR